MMTWKRYSVTRYIPKYHIGIYMYVTGKYQVYLVLILSQVYTWVPARDIP
jgi:hypothetical protein